MKIGEWDVLGRSRALLQRQMGDLGATELATHVTVNPESGRLRIYVAADIGLADYSWAPSGSGLDGDWYLRGTFYRWRSVRGVRLQTDAQIGADTSQMQSIWRLVADDPRIELAANGTATDRESVDALLAFAHACLEHAAG